VTMRRLGAEELALVREALETLAMSKARRANQRAMRQPDRASARAALQARGRAAEPGGQDLGYPGARPAWVKSDNAHSNDSGARR
jgi:hypothetical protein